jgi:hypothetical protein
MAVETVDQSDLQIKCSYTSPTRLQPYGSDIGNQQANHKVTDTFLSLRTNQPSVHSQTNSAGETDPDSLQDVSSVKDVQPGSLASSSFLLQLHLLQDIQAG